MTARGRSGPEAAPPGPSRPQWTGVDQAHPDQHGHGDPRPRPATLGHGEQEDGARTKAMVACDDSPGVSDDLRGVAHPSVAGVGRKSVSKSLRLAASHPEPASAAAAASNASDDQSQGDQEDQLGPGLHDRLERRREPVGEIEARRPMSLEGVGACGRQPAGPPGAHSGPDGHEALTGPR
jgi:hypothetical protein